MNTMRMQLFVTSLLALAGCVFCSNDWLLTTSDNDIDLVVGDETNITLSLIRSNGDKGGDVNSIIVNGYTKHDDILRISPASDVRVSSNMSAVVVIAAMSPGHDIAFFNTTAPNVTFDKSFVRVTVAKNSKLVVTSLLVGWIYFVAWSVSFYPQIYENWRRKSVVGLNFDFIALNVVGFLLYSVFNCALYWIPEIEAEYSQRHPRGLNPVQMNDIVFSIHAFIATTLTIIQCLIYERGGQTVSMIGRTILGVFTLTLIITVILSSTGIIHWLDFFYVCSYVKLAITLIKYIPQAFMNYQRKSTIGWSIGNVVLDFTGGILSMLQMLVNADNYDDWASIFGDPTKFGLGLFSVLFDIFFLIQHYILYRNSSKTVYVFE